jgi:hypothetical protein
MSHRVSSSNLDEAIKEVMAAWGRTRDYWRDKQAVAFEKDYLEKLPSLASQARTVIEELDAVMRKIKSDCDSQL